MDRVPNVVPLLLLAAGVAGAAWTARSMIGGSGSFEWIEAGESGPWRLVHTVRGTVAAFNADSVRAVEAYGMYSDFRVSFVLGDGRTFAVSTSSTRAPRELQRFAATSGLPPGRARLTGDGGVRWTNGSDGFSPAACAGIYRTSPPAPPAAVELRWAAGRLTGTLKDAGGVRPLRAVKVTEDGDIEYTLGRQGFFARLVQAGRVRGALINGVLEAEGARYERR
jgi:hypothetical protein